jgi:formate hydrogenlyase subunit 3/multisubunit Na+/H+ antiporter MnhD subunit
MSLSAFFLVMFHDERAEVRRGAWMYLIATHLATTVCLLPLLGLLFSATHTTAFSDIPAALQSAGKPFLTALFFIGLIGFGTKAGFFPMHIWLPAAHPVAPTPVSALLSGVVAKMGIYGLLRLLTWLPPLPVVCGACLLAVAIVSGVMGVLYALAQHDLKRLLAYHTIENIGIIGIGIAVGMLGRAANEPAVAALGFAGALLHVTNHALFKGLLFLSAGNVLHGTGTLAIERLGGLAKKTPANALFFLVGAIAICGLPPLNGFVSEWVIYAGLFTGVHQDIGASGGVPALGVFSLALMGGLALACFAKVFGVVFLGHPRDAHIEPHATPPAMKLSMSGLAIACVFIGLAPGYWVPLTYGATGTLVGLEADQVGASFRNVLNTGSSLSAMAAVFLGIAGGLALFRRALRGRADAVPQLDTWGCGYARPDARMQYTATSFASPLMRAFRGLLWPEYNLVAPIGPFPAKSHVEIHTPDLAEHDFFAPLFRGTARFFAMYRNLTWTGLPATGVKAQGVHGRVGPLATMLTKMAAALRKGTIQVYLTFIAITIILLFLIEGLSTDRATPPQIAPVSGSTSGIGIDQ